MPGPPPSEAFLDNYFSLPPLYPIGLGKQGGAKDQVGGDLMEKALKSWPLWLAYRVTLALSEVDMNSQLWDNGGLKGVWKGFAGSPPLEGILGASAFFSGAYLLFPSPTLASFGTSCEPGIGLCQLRCVFMVPWLCLQTRHP